ncbi:MAG: hypothetical protein ACJ72Q_13280 [Nitrososphaeraceae archaeon]
MLAYENKCAMCGKDAIIKDGHEKKKEKEQQQQQNNSFSSTMIVEQINGTYYTFDTADCALIFKRFKAVYGSNLADE